MLFDSRNGDFDAEILLDTSITSPTEVHVFIHPPAGAPSSNSTVWYPAGVDVTVETESGAKPSQLQVEQNTLSFLFTDQAVDDQIARVRVRAKTQKTDDT